MHDWSKRDAILISIDVPSGWSVDCGPSTDAQTPALSPHCLISLTAPKLCAAKLQGAQHWLGGRFVPSQLAAKYHLTLPSFEGTEQCLKLSG